MASRSFPRTTRFYKQAGRRGMATLGLNSLRRARNGFIRGGALKRGLLANGF
jgi:hypothetical protein